MSCCRQARVEVWALGSGCESCCFSYTSVTGVRILELCGGDGECGLLATPEVQRALVVLAAWASVDDDGCAVRRSYPCQFLERGGWRVIIRAVCVVLLARAVTARPLCAAVVDLEVVKVPEHDARHVFICQGDVNIAGDDLALVVERPLRIGLSCT